MEARLERIPEHKKQEQEALRPALRGADGPLVPGRGDLHGPSLDQGVEQKNEDTLASFESTQEVSKVCTESTDFP